MTHPSKETAAARIAQFVTSFEHDNMPSAACNIVGRAIIDTVATAIAGANEPVSKIALRHVHEEGGPRKATTWAHPTPVSTHGAAFYNGVAGHALDFDDVSSPMRGHPSVAMLPALLALAQARGCHGRRLTSAYTVGLQVMVSISRAMVSDHYAKGWHATATIGMLGAAAACSHLLQLSAGQTVNALGLAFAQCAGSQASFGTMAKPFQAGHCNASALRAVLLAEAGMDAAADALDGEQGFTALYGNGEPLTTALDRMASGELTILSSGLEIKKYPMCYAAHRAIDGLLDLRQEHHMKGEGIASIKVQSNHRGLVPLIHPLPQTGLEAKFSMPYAMAAAAYDGHIRLASFTDAAVQRTAIRELMENVFMEEADGPVTRRWSVVTVTLKDGTVHQKDVRILRGSHEDPLSDDELLKKWIDCLEYGGHTDPQERFFTKALAVGTMPIAELITAQPRPLHYPSSRSQQRVM